MNYVVRMCILSLIACLVPSASLAVVLNAKSAMVLDATTGTILVEKQSHDRRPIASITKLMTAMIVLDSNPDMEEKITITDEDVKNTLVRRRPTGTTLRVGTRLSRSDLLHLSLMNSHNRAAHALARTYFGGKDKFVELMNLKAAELGMLDTVFTEPTGLYNSNISTASDLIKLVIAASSYLLIREYSTATSPFLLSQQNKSSRRRITEFNTTNRLLMEDAWDIVVQKTGYITDAGRCLVMLATIADRSVAIVLLNTTTNKSRAMDAISVAYWVANHRPATKSELNKLNPYKQS